MAQPPGVGISFTEAQGFSVLGKFLGTVAAPYPISMVRQVGNTAPGVNNRVPEPSDGDFIVMSSLSMPRLSTNLTTFADNAFTGSITGNALTVTAIQRGTVPIGSLFIDTSYPSAVAAGTIITSQISGTPNGIGVYSVSVSQNLTSRALYAGIRFDMAPAQWEVQLDIHGPNSMQNARTIDTLIRSDYAVDFFAAQGLPIVPLYCGDPRQAAWENSEQQMEFRWVMEVCLEIDVIITVPQQFADQVKINLIEADDLPS